MRIACVQTNVTFADPQENVQRVLRAMDHAIGAEVIVFPECMLSGYAFESRQTAFEAAIDLSSPLIERIARTAATLGQTVSVGTLLVEEAILSNAALLIDGRGVIDCYRKTHLPRLGADRFVDRGTHLHDPVEIHATGPINAGINPTSASCRIGQAICYDASFPETLRVLALKGADLVTLGTNWPEGTETVATIVPRTRSLENRIYVAASNRVGTENGCRFVGRSSICGPDGETLASANEEEEAILEAEIDLNRCRSKTVRYEGTEFEVQRFSDRRPALYESLSHEDKGLDE